MFQTLELVSLGLALLALAFMIVVYMKERGKPGARKILKAFVMVYLFVFLNRFFTNAEAVAFREVLNLLEHLSIVLAAAALIYAVSVMHKKT